MKREYPLTTPSNPRPNKTLLQIGVYSVILHILLQLIMFFYKNRYIFISYNMLNYEWFNGSITVLFLIEHAVWLHMLWMLARPPYFSLGVAYTAVLLLTIAWIMEVVVPVDPDPYDYHGKFCIVFVFGSVFNCVGSLWLLPGKAQGVDPSYKYIISITTVIAILASAAWLGVRLLNGIVEKVTEDTKNHIFLHEPSLEITSYNMYLAGLGVGMHFWATI
jgi:hypothetical protein